MHFNFLILIIVFSLFHNFLIGGYMSGGISHGGYCSAGIYLSGGICSDNAYNHYQYY